MSAAGSAAARHAFAALLAALAVAIFGFSQPFLAVIASQMLVRSSGSDVGSLTRRIFAIAAGLAAGLILLAGFPQQPWISLPLAGFVAGTGAVALRRRLGPMPSLLFLMAIVASFGQGLVVPRSAFPASFEHAASLVLAVCAAGLANAVFPQPAERQCRPDVPIEWAVLAGVGLPLGFVFGATVFPASMVPMGIALVSTVCSLDTPCAFPASGARSLGGLAGAAISIVFLILLAGSGNDITSLLLGLAILLGGAEFLATKFPALAPFFQQAAAVMAVATPTLRSPPSTLAAIFSLLAAILAGFFFVLLLAGCFRLPRKRA